ncbi:hypothetical protein F8388_022581 [Cannabis sativa]|uniref:Endonuclease/exonuclease/phosphatase domain-containing protein n=1 Tax=Cannabis sativa TaxID=3483 RepID=A0A7J6G1X7_CANSA|nr:hypothetical protein F8388_022581 [Cannabis sativa]
MTHVETNKKEVSCHSAKIVHGSVSTTLGRADSCSTRENVVPLTVGNENLNGDGPRLSIGPEILNLPKPDFAGVEGRMDLVPDIGPTIAQSLNIPHSWVCRSQRPHNYQEPVPLRWPNNDNVAQKMFFQLYDPDYLDLYKAQPSIIPNPPNLSEMIDHVLGRAGSSGNARLEELDGEGKFCMGTIETPKVVSKGRNRKAKTKDVGRLKFWRRRGGGLKHAPTFLLRCLSWNCRGLRRPTAERTLRGLLRDTNVDMMFLSETKVGEDFMVNILNRLGFINSVCIPSVGIGGGFFLAWRMGVDIQHITNMETGFNVIFPKSRGFCKWHLFCVYGTPYSDSKEEFWRLFTEKVADCNEPWVVIGDLNVILNENEKVGGRKFKTREGDLLKEFLLSTGGVDLGGDGVKCMWHNSRRGSNRVRKRLDRALANVDWCTSHPEAKVTNLPIVGSDHAPILLDSWCVVEKLYYPFRFLEVWTSHTGCHDVVDRSWKQYYGA